MERITPKYIDRPFCNSGDYNTIPIPSQIGITPGAASFTDGFPPLTMTALGSGGVPPSGQDFNGILRRMTEHILFQNSGLKYRFDSSIVAALSGYDAGATLQNDAFTAEYINISNANTVDFDTTPASIGVSWIYIAGSDSKYPVGHVLELPYDTPPTGYLMLDGSLISRTVYANLFALLGTTFGAGDGSTSFQLPDMRGKFPRGWAHGSTVDPDRASRTTRGDGTTGDSIGTNQASAFQYHNHGSQTIYGTTGTWNGVWSMPDLGVPQPYNSTYYGGNETRPANIYVNFAIKY